MNDKPQIKPKGITPLKHICMTIGELPSSYLETMTYYEMLLWFTKFLQEKMIPALDNNALAVEELQQLFIELQTYVNDYFDNLDVQEEINNKLDQMLEDGVLEQIIEQYIQSSTLWCFNSVSDMKEATNLIDGSYAKTIGYYSANDGGGATYRIREKTIADEIDEMFIIEINDSLVAELVRESQINVLQLGAKGDGETDNTEIFDKLDGMNIYVPEGIFIVENIKYTGSTSLVGLSRYKSILKLKDNATIPRVLTMTTGLGCVIKHIGFNGNKQNQTARDNEYDACVTFRSLGGLYKMDISEVNGIFIENSINNGLFLGAGYTEEVTYPFLWTLLMNDVYIRDCDKYGMYDKSSDNKFSNFKVTHNGLGDLYCYQASSNTYVNFKLDGESGWLGNSSSNIENASLIIKNCAYLVFTNLDQQSAWETGCKINGARTLTINGLIQNNGTRWVHEASDTDKHGVGIKIDYVWDSSFDVTFGYQSHNQQTDISIDADSYNVCVLYQRDLLNQNYTPAIINNSSRCYITEKKELLSLYNMNFDYNPNLKAMTIDSTSPSITQETIDGETYYKVDSQGNTLGITFTLDTSLEAGKLYYIVAKRKIVTPATSSPIGEPYPYFNVIDSGGSGVTTNNVSNISTDKVALVACFTASQGGNKVRLYSNNNGVYGLNNFYIVKADKLNYSSSQSDMANFRASLINYSNYGNFRIPAKLNSVGKIIEICAKNI